MLRSCPPLLLTLGLLASTVAAPAAPDAPPAAIEVLPTDSKLAKIVLIAGTATPRLKTGEHEYFAGSFVLMKMLRQSPGVFPVLVRDGWPKNPETLAGARAVVLFLEGGTAHAALKGKRLQELQNLADSGAGIVHLHSAIDYGEGPGERVRGLAGASWDKGYSQRAHWVAEFDRFSEHPVFRGVTPFKIDDGWLWKHRYTAGMKGVTPLLRTRSPKDPPGKTSDDDAAVSWLYERPGGGRSFTFTGGHLHESWKLDGYRRFIVNGILWTARQEIPTTGAPVALDPTDLRQHLEHRGGATPK